MFVSAFTNKIFSKIYLLFIKANGHVTYIYYDNINASKDFEAT